MLNPAKMKHNRLLNLKTKLRER